ncbi:MAG TPA: ferredoxin [Pseudonocardia sp.]
MGARLSIDGARCAGHQICAIMMPELFDNDDLGYGIVLGDGSVPDDQHNALEQVMHNCPEQAITITEQNGA